MAPIDNDFFLIRFFDDFSSCFLFFIRMEIAMPCSSKRENLFIDSILFHFIDSWFGSFGTGESVIIYLLKFRYDCPLGIVEPPCSKHDIQLHINSKWSERRKKNKNILKYIFKKKKRVFSRLHHGATHLGIIFIIVNILSTKVMQLNTHSNLIPFSLPFRGDKRNIFIFRRFITNYQY